MWMFGKVVVRDRYSVLQKKKEYVESIWRRRLRRSNNNNNHWMASLKRFTWRQCQGKKYYREGKGEHFWNSEQSNHSEYSSNWVNLHGTWFKWTKYIEWQWLFCPFCQQPFHTKIVYQQPSPVTMYTKTSFSLLHWPPATRRHSQTQRHCDGLISICNMWGRWNSCPLFAPLLFTTSNGQKNTNSEQAVITS